jgi:hypothetical protein
MATNKFGFDPDYKIPVTPQLQSIRIDAEEARRVQEEKDAVEAEYNDALDSVIIMISKSIDYLIEDKTTAKYIDINRAARYIVSSLLKHNVPLRMIQEAAEYCRIRYAYGKAMNNIGSNLAHCIDVASRGNDDFEM